MTTETYLDLTYERATKSAKRPIRPKLLKLTDVTIPHRNRKKTKVKSKDRSQSSVRDRIYDDPAYTDDISHLANPLRRSSCSGKAETQTLTATTPTRGSSSLGKRSKLTKEFLQYSVKSSKGRGGGGMSVVLSSTSVGGGGGSSGNLGSLVAAYERGALSSSDENLPTEASRSSMGKRGRSMERNAAAADKISDSKKRGEKRDRSSKQKRNLSLDNNLQSQFQQLQQYIGRDEGDYKSISNYRSKERPKPQKQYSDGPNENWTDSSKATPEQDEANSVVFSVRSSATSAKDATNTKMQIGRRFLKGEIGIKSFNYYLLKEGLKSSKKFVEKQRHSLTGGLAGGHGKKSLSRSEENIYEEIFFKEAPTSDDDPQHTSRHQQHAETSHSTLEVRTESEDVIYPDCELCMQQCTRENCEYCFAAPEVADKRLETAGRRFTNNDRQLSLQMQQQQQQQQSSKQQHQQFGSLGRGVGYINHAPTKLPPAGNELMTAGAPQMIRNDNNNGHGSGNNNNNNNSNSNNNMPTAHILEFQSYNPNNPGVYKIETTPVAITGEYNPILQFQQSATTAALPEHQHQQAQQQQQQQQQFHQQRLPHNQGYNVQSGGNTTSNHHHHQSTHYASSATGVPTTAFGITGAGNFLPTVQQPTRRAGNGGGGRFVGNGSMTVSGGGSVVGQNYIVGFHGTGAGNGNNMQRLSTKSSSSSDSLQQQHKFNTMTRLDHNNVLIGDPFYGGGIGGHGIGHGGHSGVMHPLMFAASRPIGGSQILVDSYEPPNMYKSDSKASILSEYSLRSSDNSQRFHRYRSSTGYIGGRGEVSDSSLGDSMFSYASAQRRFYGSSESCRFAFECRRCSLDGGGIGLSGTGEKCSFSDNCRYECRNCDCGSSSYFSSDFDEVYGSIAGGAALGSGIPRKTAAGTLPSSSTPPTEYATARTQQEQLLDLKQNKYAQDFFKHVNDVKRSIYQSELQRSSGGMDAIPQQRSSSNATGTKKSIDSNQKVHSSSSSGQTSSGGRNHANTTGSPKHGEKAGNTAPETAATYSTLPLTKERMRTQSGSLANRSSQRKEESIEQLRSKVEHPLPAPRSSLQQHAAVPLPPLPAQRRSQASLERREYPSLDRLVASATGAIPKSNVSSSSAGHKPAYTTGTDVGKNSPRHSPKSMRITDRPLEISSEEVDAKNANVSQPQKADTATTEVSKREKYLMVSGGVGDNSSSISSSSKKHHQRSSSSRRKDIPAPPPPSPATCADLQELNSNVESSTADAKNEKSQQQQSVTLATTNSSSGTEHARTTQIVAVAAATNIQQKQQQQQKQEVACAALRNECKIVEPSKETANLTAGKKQQQPQQRAPMQNSNNNRNAQIETTNNVTAATTSTTMTTTTSTLPVAGRKLMDVDGGTCTSISASGNFERRIAQEDKITVEDEDDDDVFYDARSAEDSADAATAASSVATSSKSSEADARAARRAARRREEHLDEGHKKVSVLRQQQQQQQQEQTQKNSKTSNKSKQADAVANESVAEANLTAVTTTKVDGTNNDEKKLLQQQQQQRQEQQQHKQDNNNEANQRKRRQHKQEQQQLEKLIENEVVAAAVAAVVDENQITTSTKTLNLKQVSTVVTAAAATKTSTTAATTVTIAAKLAERSNMQMVEPKQQKIVGIEMTTTTTTTTTKKSSGRSSSKHATPTTTTANGKQQQHLATLTTDATETATICESCCQEKCARQHKNEKKLSKTKMTIAAAAAVTEDVTRTTTTPTPAVKSKEKAIKTKTDTQKTTAKEKEPEAKISTTPTTCANDTDNMSPAAAVNSSMLPIQTVTNSKKETTQNKEIGGQIENVAKKPSNMLQQQIETKLHSQSTPMKQSDDSMAKSVELQNVAATFTTQQMETKTGLLQAQVVTAVAAAATNEMEPTITKSTTTSELASTPTTTTAAITSLDPAAAAAQTQPQQTAAVARCLTSNEVSCVSDIAGVVVVPNVVANSEAQHPPSITTTTPSTEQLTKRPPLYRQDYSCLDSSEAFSDDSHLTRDSCRESQNDELSSSINDKIDVTNLPLPALPPKKRHRSRSRASPSKYQSNKQPSESDVTRGESTSKEGESKPLTAFQQYAAKRRESFEASSRSFNDKLEARKMHYHTGSGGGAGSASMVNNAASMHKPTYLFGENYYGGGGADGGGGTRNTGNMLTNEEIFLNKSGWVQVNTKRINDENAPGSYNARRAHFGRYEQQNGGSLGGSRDGNSGSLRNTIRVIQIDNTRGRRADGIRQSSLQHQHSFATPSGYSIPKISGSKIEELISRNEARRSNSTTHRGSSSYVLRPGYKIVDPQIATLLNERPGFLPVRNYNDADSPPPITPILSPPPAFQDSKAKYSERRQPPQTLVNAGGNNSLHASNSGGNNKGMVFSRSFEYDNRKITPTDTYVETFSRSFDGNLSEKPRAPVPQRDRSPNFSTLTGCSPNYLTKKDSGGGSSGSLRSRDSSPKYQQPQSTAYLNTSVKEAPPAYSVASSKYGKTEKPFERNSKNSNVLGRSRKAQFSRVSSSGPLGVGASQQQQRPPSVAMSRFRSFDTTISQRLNSCDSGARSDLSNDELDNEDDDGSTEFLTANYHHNHPSPFKTQRQRSLTPDRNDSHSSSSSLRKQRSLTPESRSLTPEERRKKGSQGSLIGSRQNSSSRSNTLERKQKYDDKTVNISRSSSSSSYSGRGEPYEGLTTHTSHLSSSGVGGLVSGVSSSQHRRAIARAAKQVDEHRIRRSRSLQLTERSPNRTHKMVVCVGQPHAGIQQGPIYQQANIRANNVAIAGGHNNFPPTIRTTVNVQPILVNSNGGRMRNVDIDKSRSFDFDYGNYANSSANNTNTSVSNSNISNINSGSNNQNVPMRLDFDKSRSFDDDYREQSNNNNSLGGGASTSGGGMRYLHTNDAGSSGGGIITTTRLRRSSPGPAGNSAGGGGAGSHSPQSSGSSSNNLNQTRQSTSPQSYGTRLCDHELTYDMLRKSLDRSPIMDFRRADSGSGEYDMLPPQVSKNRETITAGGNSELNFLNNEARIYDHPTTIKQRSGGGGGLGQSPSESQYSLERFPHNTSRDSITPESGSEYKTLLSSDERLRAEYLYRQQQQQQQQRGNNRGSKQTTKTATTTTTTPNQKSTTNTTKTSLNRTKSTTLSCSFWPHCGACNNLATFDNNTTVTLKRQNSLRNLKELEHKRQQAAETTTDPYANQKHCCHTTQDALENGGNRVVVPLHRAICNERETTSSSSLVSPSRRNVNETGDSVDIDCSTVSVNVKVIKFEKAVKEQPLQKQQQNGSVLKSRPWTLLHSTKPNGIKQVGSPRSDQVNDNITVERVVPLAATSSVFLGDCEMPITRDTDSTIRVWENGIKRGSARSEDKENACDSSKNYKRFIKQSASRNTATAKTPTELNHNSNRDMNQILNARILSTTTAATIPTTIESSELFQQHQQQEQRLQEEEQQQHRQRSISLPDIFQTTGFSANSTTTTTSTTNNGISVSVIGIRSSAGCNGDFKANGFSTNLAHQLRAISSPSLTETTTTQDGNIKAETTATMMPNRNATKMLSPTEAAECGSESQGNSNSTLMTSISNQNVGVLQKFKRTFSNFNRSQPQQQQQTNTILHIPAAINSSSSNSSITNISTTQLPTATSSGTIFTVTSASASAIEMQCGDTPQATTDQNSGKYRFGQLIWRSSKERRKTKYNRRDKCNSGDSGIQIELENDEQFVRVIGGSRKVGGIGANEAKDTTNFASHKSRIRRANSAKATSNSSSAATYAAATNTALLSAKAKVLKKIDAYDCRVAPASIPPRSLSQPSGLDRLATPSRTNADLDESDTDSVSSSHPDCNEVHHHRPIYAEVLYNFTPASPQELALERGALVEILRKEIGPWWYGRIKSDAVVETLFEPQLGWFPKDFVRIIQFPETDGFYTAAVQQQQRVIRSKLTSPSMDETLIAKNTTTTAIVGTGSNNNVTTIVIDPAATEMLSNNTPVKRSTSAYSQSEEEETETEMLPMSKSINVLLHGGETIDILRNSAVKELYDTEVNYVKLLASICRGYIPAMSKRIDIFTPDSIKLIFSNIEHIFKFQQQFLEALRRGIEQNRVAQVFLEHQSEFLVYSIYCNSYPRALIELETYSRNKDAKMIFENCRVAENLPELPLSAHLLAPIQRICRYPLHLAELIKNSFNKSSTTNTDGDKQQEKQAPIAPMEEIDASLLDVLDTKESLEMALKAMKNVTEAVNEGKRHSENLARHQSNFENFSGPPLHFHSTRYFMQIDATRVSPNLWNNTYTLFLFDHQLIYCKKDILKRQHFIYKGRIFLDSCRILNLPDGKIFGATVKNALRIYCDTRNKWFDFSFRSANRKRRFLTTLALERQFCGKNLFISELAGEDADERDLSDREYHSDYEAPMSVPGLHGGEGTYSSLNLHCKENMYDAALVNGSGSNSMPESPSKLHKYSDTLPKKSQRHNTTNMATTTAMTVSTKDPNYDYSTSSLGRRKLGNWFRKSKSTNSTPNQSPTHQTMVLGTMMQLHSDSSSLSSPALGNGKPMKELSTSTSS